jgi:hypothetical protein
MSLSQPGFLRQLVRSVGITSETATTPSDQYLQTVDKLSPLLTSAKALLFVTFSMQLLFATGKTRHDLRFHSCWLTTRLAKPTEQDFRKLLRIARFINSNPDRPLIFRPGPLVLVVVGDATHGSYGDGCGQAGIWAHLSAPGGAGTSAVSTKNHVATGAAHAETHVQYLASAEVIHQRLALADLRHPQATTVQLCDNKSAITILNKGPGWGGRSRMFECKLFWVTHQIKNKVLRLEYVPGPMNNADGLSRSKSVAEFPAFADTMQGQLPT